ncbi:MAG: holo-[acyl-carrier protein] synthase [Hyphomicrobiaceae bacterium]|jgi:holo-[acyl-carrier protein] synthase
MSIHAVGVDLCDISRMRALLAREKTGARLARRVFTPAERAQAQTRPDPVASLAARFAAKEATLKALARDKPWGMPWLAIEIVAEVGSKVPRVKLLGKAAQWAEEVGIAHVHLSMSHERDYAIAMAVAETE